jgi:hypothetical protein
MTMAFKYQVSLSLQPKDILLVTLNHMDAVYTFVEDNPPIKQQVENVYRLVLQVSYFLTFLLQERTFNCI